MDIRIICVGNRYLSGDDVGPRVCDRLAEGTLPENVRVIDGGLRGLDLLSEVEGAARVVIVDNVAGLGPPGGIVVLDRTEMMGPEDPAYGHGDGLAFLARALPAVLDGTLPELFLVGLEGPADEEAVDRVAATCMSVAVEGSAMESRTARTGEDLRNGQGRDAKRLRGNRTPAAGGPVRPRVGGLHCPAGHSTVRGDREGPRPA